MSMTMGHKLFNEYYLSAQKSKNRRREYRYFFSDTLRVKSSSNDSQLCVSRTVHSEMKETQLSDVAN